MTAIERRSLVLPLAVVGGLIVTLALAAGQGRESLPVDLSPGPTRPGFDLDRLSNAGNGWFETFYVDASEPLVTARDEGRVSDSTPVLVVTGMPPVTQIGPSSTMPIWVT